MFEQGTVEKVCPSCKKNFFPQKKEVSKTFCGEELVCSPPGENYKSSDCRSYFFCSTDCLEDFEDSLPTCRSISSWRRFMEKINRISTTNGIAGARPHHLSKYNK